MNLRADRRPLSHPRPGERVLPEMLPPMSVGRSLGKILAAELRKMAIETRALIRELSREPGADAQLKGAQDAIPDDAQHRLNMLNEKWQKRFEALAWHWARKMVTDVTASSTAQLTHGLRDVADLQQIQSTMQTPRMRALVEASAQASVGLITRIPQRFLGDVQTKVMSAITKGSGLSQLVPYLTKRYKGDARWAHLVALDQVRKVSENVNATRLQTLGVEEYVWMHVGGERYPRKLHQEYSGRVFRYDDPPIIDERTGERGKPGDAIFCRCRQRPVLNFTKLAA